MADLCIPSPEFSQVLTFFLIDIVGYKLTSLHVTFWMISTLSMVSFCRCCKSEARALRGMGEPHFLSYYFRYHDYFNCINILLFHIIPMLKWFYMDNLFVWIWSLQLQTKVPTLILHFNFIVVKPTWTSSEVWKYWIDCIICNESLYLVFVILGGLWFYVELTGLLLLLLLTWKLCNVECPLCQCSRD